MKVDVRKDQIKERKVDDSGRISIGKREYAGKKVEVIITDVIEEDEDQRVVRDPDTGLCAVCGTPVSTHTEGEKEDCLDKATPGKGGEK